MDYKYEVHFTISTIELVNPNIPDGARHFVDYRWIRYYNDKDIMYNDIYYTMKANYGKHILFNVDIFDENKKHINHLNDLENVRYRESKWYNIINPSDIDKMDINEEILGVFNGDRWGTDKSNLTFYFDDDGVLIEHEK